MQSPHHDRFQYFREQSNTSNDYYISYVRPFVAIDSHTTVLEIGCGEGGNLLPFACLGCKVTGIDKDPERIRQAIMFFRESGKEGQFILSDFMSYPCPKMVSERFDVILVHDVIEHIQPSEKYSFLMHIHGFLKRDGIVFFGFPAWHNPFGGHQQISVGFASRLPFIHLLPNCIYKGLLYRSGASREQIDELMLIKQARMTIEQFDKLAMSTGYRIADRTLWLVNPHYKQKFNLSARRLWPLLSSLPYIRNYFTTSAFYILSDKLDSEKETLSASFQQVNKFVSTMNNDYLCYVNRGRARHRPKDILQFFMKKGVRVTERPATKRLHPV